MSKSITKKEFDELSSDIYFIWTKGYEKAPACPQCGQKSTMPIDGCKCSRETGHIMKYHHICY